MSRRHPPTQSGSGGPATSISHTCRPGRGCPSSPARASCAQSRGPAGKSSRRQARSPSGRFVGSRRRNNQGECQASRRVVTAHAEVRRVPFFRPRRRGARVRAPPPGRSTAVDRPLCRPTPTLPPKWRNFVHFVPDYSATSTARWPNGGKVSRPREPGRREQPGSIAYVETSGTPARIITSLFSSKVSSR